MTDSSCSDVVRCGGDLALAPQEVQDSLRTHLGDCADCASYVSQMATTGTLIRNALLARAQLLDPADAEDLTQRAMEVGLARQRRDSRPRGLAELTRILHTLSDARARLQGRTTPAVDVAAADRVGAASFEDLDLDADEPELLYPDLYPDDDGLDRWPDSPNQWRGGAQVPGPEEVDETGELYDVVDRALGELPEPLGNLLALVDLQGQPLADSAQSLGLDELSAGAALARARNHVRGRVDEYLKGAGV